MAITSASQILDTSKVNSAVALIDDVIGYLNSAKESLTTAKSYCDESVFCTNEGNPFPADIKKVDEQLSDEISRLRSLKTTITNEASSVRSREQTELANFQAEQKRIAEEKAAAQAAANSQSNQMVRV